MSAAKRETIEVRRQQLEELIQQTKQVIRRHSQGKPDTNGWAPLATALGSVVRDIAEADLRVELGEALPVPVPHEEKEGDLK